MAELMYEMHEMAELFGVTDNELFDVLNSCEYMDLEDIYADEFANDIYDEVCNMY